MAGLIRLKEWLAARPRSTTYLALSLFVLDLLLVYVDHESGPFLPLTAFYVLLIYLAARYVAPRFSYFIGMLSAAGRTFAVSQAFPESAYVLLTLWQFASSALVYSLLTHLFSRELHRIRSPDANASEPGSASPATNRKIHGRRTILGAFVITVVASLVYLSSQGDLLARYRIDPSTDRIVENPLLRGTRSLELVNIGQPLLLTFDDGPSDVEVDHKILAILKEHHARAVWFINCRNLDPALTPDADRNRKTLREIAAGHVIGNHGYTHLSLRQINPADTQALNYEIEDCSRMIYSVVKARPRYFRAPFGQLTIGALPIIERSIMQPVGWTNNTNDRSYLGQPERYRPHLFGPRGFVETVEPGDNILMHEIALTADTLDDLLRALEAKGFVFVAPD